MMHIQRIVTVQDVEVDQLPDDLRVLSAIDVEVLEDHKSYFKSLARKAKPPWLKKVLRECAKTGKQLQFYAENDEPFVPYFRFWWGGGPAISLPREGASRADLPPFLSHFYSLIGEFRENPFDLAGGVTRIEDLRSIEESGVWVEEPSEVDPAEAIGFLETASGEQLCYLPDGRGAWYEECYFRIVADPAAEMARYFEALLEGTRI